MGYNASKGIEPRNLLKMSEADIVHNRAGGILVDGKARLQEPDGVRDRTKMSKGTAINSGEPICSRKECSLKSMNGKRRQNITYRQSDYFVVSKKPRNWGGEKGVAGMQRELRDTTAIHCDGVRLSTKLSSLTSRAKENPKYKLTSVTNMLMTEDFLRGCFWRLKRDKSPGIDRVTVEEYGSRLGDNLKDLVKRLRSWEYRPQPVKRVYIPKADGTKRGLGIPAVEDKIVQMGITRILEAVFEIDFQDVSFGFRPKRNCHQALNALDKAIMLKPVNCVVDMDIKKFFDTIDHKWLMRCLRQRITDRSLLRLIGRFLTTGVMEEGNLLEVDKGTPQGGIISPILANIYLHYVLDLWFEKIAKKELRGYAQLIRFADDFVVMFQSKYEADKFAEKLKQRLSKFGLRVAEDKSKVIEFGRYVWQRAQREKAQIGTFDFLGFTHYCDKTLRGGFKLGRKTSRTKYIQKVKAMNQWLKKIRNQVKLIEWWGILKRKLIGHYNYYGLSGNYEALVKFYRLAMRLAYKWINRRSQRKSFSYARYRRFMRYSPLPKPKIYHSIYMTSPC